MIDEKPIVAVAVFDQGTTYSAHLVHLGLQRIWARGLVLMAAAIVLPLGCWSWWYGSELLGLCLIGLSLWGGGQALVEGYQIRRSIRRSWQQLDCGEAIQVRFEISPQDLRMKDKESSSCVQWSKFRRWREGRGLILSYRTDDTYWTIPVNQFEPEAQDALRAQLTAHVPRA